MLVLKRLADAERDGDRIYAVIKGVGGSSDGRGRSMTAPRLEGQMLALRRAYAQAGVDVPPSVSLKLMAPARRTGTPPRLPLSTRCFAMTMLRRIVARWAPSSRWWATQNPPPVPPAS